MRAAPAVSCAIAHRKRAHEHTGSAEAIRHSLRNGFTAYFVLSSVNGFLATVVSGTPRSIHLDRCATANLTPAPRRQDHTTSPYASGAHVQRAICVHRISPHVRDDREPAPQSGETGGVMKLICPTMEAEYFCRAIWTPQITLKWLVKFVFTRSGVCVPITDISVSCAFGNSGGAGVRGFNSHPGVPI